MLLRRCAPLLAAIVALACSTKDQAAGSSDTAAAPPVAATDLMPMAMDSGMQGMANMTGDADHDFLRMMSDHHSGLIAMSHDASEKAGATVKREANRLDSAQDTELEQMKGVMSKEFKNDYKPSMMPDAKAMLDELKPLSGKSYDRKYLENVIRHHEEALTMIDGYVPKAKRSDVRTMAEKMKADQSKEIAKFRGMLAKM